MVNRVLQFPHSIYKRLRLKTQIILGISLLQSLFTFMLVFDQYLFEKKFLQDQSLKQSFGLIESISNSAMTPLLSKDFAGIENLIKAYSKNYLVSKIQIYDGEKKLAGVIRKLNNEILGNNPDFDAQDLQIYQSISIFENSEKVLKRTNNELQISSPIIFNQKNLGWIVVEIDEKPTDEAISMILYKGLFFMGASLLVGVFFSYLFATRFINQLTHLRNVVKKFGVGNQVELADESFQNEVGELAKDFNRMARQIIDYQVKMVSTAKFSALGEMAGGIAHEINNPLAVIIGKCATIKRFIDKQEIDKDRVKTELDKITATSFRITKIINGLRSFSRDGEHEPPYWVGLDKVINDSLDLTSEKMGQLNIQIRVDIPKDIEILASAVQVSQVILNLLTNSIDAIKDIPEAWIEIKAIPKSPELLFLTFTDCGNGIPADIYEKMMQPFFTTKEVGKGTGLGLSISKGIIERHQGQFYYNAKSPKTQFVIELTQYRTGQKIESNAA